MDKMKTAKPNSAVALQPCPSGHITVDKRLCFTLPKLPLLTSFIRKTLYEISLHLEKFINVETQLSLLQFYF